MQKRFAAYKFYRRQKITSRGDFINITQNIFKTDEMSNLIGHIRHGLTTIFATQIADITQSIAYHTNGGRSFVFVNKTVDTFEIKIQCPTTDINVGALITIFQYNRFSWIVRFQYAPSLLRDHMEIVPANNSVQRNATLSDIIFNAVEQNPVSRDDG